MVVDIRNWKIIYWDNEDKEQVKYVKFEKMKEVIADCLKNNITKYSIFNDKNKNICNDGKRTTNKMVT